MPHQVLNFKDKEKIPERIYLEETVIQREIITLTPDLTLSMFYDRKPLEKYLHKCTEQIKAPKNAESRQIIVYVMKI